MTTIEAVFFAPDVVTQETEAEPKTVFCPLTMMQMEVLRLVADGMQAKDVARALSISHRTVEIHRRNINLALGGKTIPHTVAIAMRMGLIE